MITLQVLHIVLLSKTSSALTTKDFQYILNTEADNSVFTACFSFTDIIGMSEMDYTHIRTKTSPSTLLAPSADNNVVHSPRLSWFFTPAGCCSPPTLRKGTACFGTLHYVHYYWITLWSYSINIHYKRTYTFKGKKINFICLVNLCVACLRLIKYGGNLCVCVKPTD